MLAPARIAPAGIGYGSCEGEPFVLIVYVGVHAGNDEIRTTFLLDGDLPAVDLDFGKGRACLSACGEVRQEMAGLVEAQVERHTAERELRR